MASLSALRFVARGMQLHAQRRFLATTVARNQVYFTKKHEWVRVEKDNTGTVGITNYAQEALGDIVYVQLPDVDDTVTAGVDCGALESVKAASEIYSPVSGTVVQKNEAAEATPAVINSSAMGDGWLFKLKLNNTEELKKLLSEQDYDDFLKSQDGEH